MDTVRRQDEATLAGWFLDGDYVVRTRDNRTVIVGPVGEPIIEVLVLEERPEEGLVFAGESLVHSVIGTGWTRTEAEAVALDVLDAEVVA